MNKKKRKDSRKVLNDDDGDDEEAVYNNNQDKNWIGCRLSPRATVLTARYSDSHSSSLVLPFVCVCEREFVAWMGLFFVLVRSVESLESIAHSDELLWARMQYWMCVCDVIFGLLHDKKMLADWLGWFADSRYYYLSHSMDLIPLHDVQKRPTFFALNFLK